MRANSIAGFKDFMLMFSVEDLVFEVRNLDFFSDRVPKPVKLKPTEFYRVVDDAIADGA